MKKILCLFLALTLLLSLAACGKCDHNWTKATCETARTCTKCGEIDGKIAGHKWIDATCETARTCAACGKTDGTPLAHDWVDATYDAPKTCTLCGATEGESLSQALADELVGTWVAYAYMDRAAAAPEGFSNENGLPIAFIFHDDGTYEQVPYEKEFDDALTSLKADLCDYLVAQAYETAAKEGYSQKQADEAFYKDSGMTIREYAEAEVDKMGLDSLSSTKTSGTYTVRGNELTLDNRSTPLTLTIALEDDTLQILGCNDDGWARLFGDYPIELQRKD